MPATNTYIDIIENNAVPFPATNHRPANQISRRTIQCRFNEHLQTCRWTNIIPSFVLQAQLPSPLLHTTVCPLQRSSCLINRPQIFDPRPYGDTNIGAVVQAWQWGSSCVHYGAGSAGKTAYCSC
ncbi:hypothetical protein BaRGS_00022682 [Batillaria attramentaria]|uniref:Uncharacterized protein n=1 Tax=Batillaria attramentaria TaxID=370345 RepID=A0ABD0KFX3_9CAEN